MSAAPKKSSLAPSADDQKRVLTKAIMRLAARLQLSRQALSAILGLSEASLSRLFTKGLLLDPDSKEGQLALLLVRLYRSLDTLFGGNEKQCQLWLCSDNQHLRGKPMALLQSIEGLVSTVRYLDAMRGKN